MFALGLLIGILGTVFVIILVCILEDTSEIDMTDIISDYIEEAGLRELRALDHYINRELKRRYMGELEHEEKV